MIGEGMGGRGYFLFLRKRFPFTVVLAIEIGLYGRGHSSLFLAVFLMIFGTCSRQEM